MTKKPIYAVCGFALILLFIYAQIFLPYFPSVQGELGHDYSQFMPILLTGYYWFLQNGIWDIPWFSPSQCGGFPYYADPQIGYYAIPQLLSFLISPIQALRLTLLLFALTGFAGFYITMRRGFASSHSASLMCAGFFMFNGLFIYRVLIGHLTFHGFMLLPVVLAAIMNTPGNQAIQLNNLLTRICLAALCFAYMFHTGMVHVFPPMLISIAGILVLQAALFGWRWFPWVILALSGIISLALSAGKLVAEISLLSIFARNFYTLPGIKSFFSIIALAFDCIFFDVPKNTAKYIVNSQFMLDKHEWEYGVSPAPLFMILGCVVSIVINLIKNKILPQFKLPQIIAVFVILVLMTLPVLVNWYEPQWNHFLKSLPFFGNSSNLLRWFSAYIAVVVVLSGLAVDRIALPVQIGIYGRPILVMLGILVMLFTNASANKSFVNTPGYTITAVENAWKAVHAGQTPPAIETIKIFNSQPGEGPNDGMTKGISTIRCYQPLMGYRLEQFPVGALHPGPVFTDGSELINLKNPACYLYPLQNQCSPGDHFQINEKDKAESFTHYQPFDFVQPESQKTATLLSIITLVIVLLILTVNAALALKNHFKAKPVLANTDESEIELAKTSHGDVLATETIHAESRNDRQE